MNKFIIGYGRSQSVGWVYAKDRDAALMRATALSMADGCLDDDLADCVFAEPWDDHLARDYGLMWLDPAERGWETAEAIT